VEPSLPVGQEIRQIEAKTLTSRLHCAKYISCLFCGFSDFTVCLRVSLLIIVLLGTWYYCTRVDLYYNPCAEITIYQLYQQKSLECFSKFSSSKLKLTTSRRFHVSFPKHIPPFQFALLGLHNNALPVPNELIWYATLIGQLPYHAIVVCLPAKCWK
jgi:hypothetical protein